MKITLIGGPADGQRMELPDDYRDYLLTVPFYNRNTGEPDRVTYTRIQLQEDKHIYAAWIYPDEKQPLKLLLQNYKGEEFKTSWVDPHADIIGDFNKAIDEAQQFKGLSMEDIRLNYELHIRNLEKILILADIERNKLLTKIEHLEKREANEKTS